MRYFYLALCCLMGWACQEASPIRSPRVCLETTPLWVPTQTMGLSRDGGIYQPLPLLYAPSLPQTLQVAFLPYADQAAQKWLQPSMPLYYKALDSMGRAWAVDYRVPRQPLPNQMDSLQLHCNLAGDTLLLQEGDHTVRYVPTTALTWEALQSEAPPLYWRLDDSNYSVECLVHQQRNHFRVCTWVLQHSDSSWMCSYHFPFRETSLGIIEPNIALFSYWQPQRTGGELSYWLLQAMDQNGITAQHHTTTGRANVHLEAHRFVPTLSEAQQAQLDQHWQAHALPIRDPAPQSPQQETDLWWVGSTSYTLVSPSRRWATIVDDLYPSLHASKTAHRLWLRTDQRGFTVFGTKEDLLGLE